VFVAGAVATVVSAASIMVGARDSPAGALPRAHQVASRGGTKVVLRSTVFWRIAALDFFVVGPMLSVQGLWGGPFLFDVAGFSRERVGDLLTLLSIGALCGYLVSGALGNRVGIQRMALRGAALFAFVEVGLVAIALGFGGHGLLWIAYPAFGFAGGFNILLMAHARTAFPTHMTGRVVTAVNFFGIGGVAVLQWAMGVIINAYGRDAAGHYPPQAYGAAFGSAAVGTILAVVWYATLRRPVGAPVAVSEG
jgi:MFS family permease